nr:hypothetical protein Iba_chr03dCG9470 [Ipomoea batatas]
MPSPLGSNAWALFDFLWSTSSKVSSFVSVMSSTVAGSVGVSECSVPFSTEYTSPISMDSIPFISSFFVDGLLFLVCPLLLGLFLSFLSTPSGSAHLAAMASEIFSSVAQQTWVDSCCPLASLSFVEYSAAIPAPAVHFKIL